LKQVPGSLTILSLTLLLIWEQIKRESDGDKNHNKKLDRQLDTYVGKKKIFVNKKSSSD
jgi:hypothetical protein